MNVSRLTGLLEAATNSCMDEAAQQFGRTGRRAWGGAVMAMVGTMTLAGCISVNAPDKPIVIELNINIKQEVVYRLAADAGNTIEENADIF
jgi:hypothetical protein